MSDKKEFNLKQDWNWNKMIYKADDWVHQQAYDNAYNSLLDYLEIESEDELTLDLIEEAEHLIEFLETDHAEGGLGVHDSSPTYYGYYSVVRDWRENLPFDEQQGAPLI